MEIARIGKVSGRRIEKFRDGTTDVMLLQTVMSSPGDVQTVQMMGHAGDDYSPPDGSYVTVISPTRSWKVAVATEDHIPPEVDVGEREIYSSADGEKKAQIRLTNAGKIAFQTAGATESLLSILSDLIDAITDLQTFGSPASHSVTPGSQATLDAIKTRIESFLVEV